MTKVIALCVVTLSVLPSVARAQDAVSPEQQLANGWVRLAAGNAAEALQIGDDLMRQNLLVHRALQLAVMAEVRLGRVDHALDRYERWMTPNRPEDVYLVADIALGRLRELSTSQDPQVQAEALSLMAQERLTPAGGAAAPAPTGPAIDAALARAGDVDAAMRLSNRLTQPMGAEATFVLQAIGDARARNAAPGVRALLASPDPAIRAVAAQTLGKVGSAEDLPRLRELAKDRFPFVQASATVALSQLGDSAASEGVDTLLRSDAGELRLMAAEALGMAEVTRWSAAVTDLLKNDNLLIRVQAALLLSRAGVEVTAAQSALVQAMAGDNPILREQAAAAFAEGPGADPKLLRKMLRDADGRVVLRGVRGLLALVR